MGMAVLESQRSSLAQLLFPGGWAALPRRCVVIPAEAIAPPLAPGPDQAWVSGGAQLLSPVSWHCLGHILH